MSHALFGTHNIPHQKTHTHTHTHTLCLKFKLMWELYVVSDKPQQIFSAQSMISALEGWLNRGRARCTETQV